MGREGVGQQAASCFMFATVRSCLDPNKIENIRYDPDRHVLTLGS